MRACERRRGCPAGRRARRSATRWAAAGWSWRRCACCSSAWAGARRSSARVRSDPDPNPAPGLPPGPYPVPCCSSAWAGARRSSARARAGPGSHPARLWYPDRRASARGRWQTPALSPRTQAAGCACQVVRRRRATRCHGVRGCSWAWAWARTHTAPVHAMGWPEPAALLARVCSTFGPSLQHFCSAARRRARAAGRPAAAARGPGGGDGARARAGRGSRRCSRPQRRGGGGRRRRRRRGFAGPVCAGPAGAPRRRLACLGWVMSALGQGRPCYDTITKERCLREGGQSPSQRRGSLRMRHLLLNLCVAMRAMEDGG